MRKTCRCCDKTYTAEQWEELPSIGKTEDDEVTLDLRNCSCGSTLAVEVLK